MFDMDPFGGKEVPSTKYQKARTKSRGFKALGGEALIQAPAGTGLFVSGTNVLTVTVDNSGSTPNPMGLYMHGALRDGAGRADVTLSAMEQ